MNKQKKLFSHLRQKEHNRLKRNWDYFHKWRKDIDPTLFDRLCGGSCLNCRHFCLYGKMYVWCIEHEEIIDHICACHDHEPSKTNWLDKGKSYFYMEDYEP